MGRFEVLLAEFNKRRVGVGVTLAILFFAAIFSGSILMSSEQLSGGSSASGQSARTFFHVRGHAEASPAVLSGLTPSQIKSAYNLPSSGGYGTTIAIIDAFDDPTVASDLNVFSSRFGLTPVNFIEHKMSSSIPVNGGWALEISLDVQWAHAIAPNATILLVEAQSNSVSDLMSAVSYATSQPNVVAVSMSWGASEFSSETFYDSYFTDSGMTFFASSGDNGAGVIWPASSPNVVGVGGTTLNLNLDGTFDSETAWSGSGGGVSTIELEPTYQQTYGVQGTSGHRGVPDVSYNADPSTGVLVYDSTPYNGGTGWWIVGGTSAGAPQWAAIQSLGRSASNANFYMDAKSSSYASYFRDITNGSNGNPAIPGYDLVTGLGSPLTTYFTPRNAHLVLGVQPNQATFSKGQSLALRVSVLNQLNPPLNSTLTLTITGPGNYYYYDFQTVNVAADSVSEFVFSWNIPALAGTYVIETSLVPAMLTAYDAEWIAVN